MRERLSDNLIEPVQYYYVLLLDEEAVLNNFDVSTVCTDFGSLQSIDTGILTVD
jgi:hypothetical protein